MSTKVILTIFLFIFTFFFGVLAISNLYLVMSEHVDYTYQANDPNYNYEFSAYNTPTYKDYLEKKEEYKNEYISATPYVKSADYCPIKYGYFDEIGCSETIIVGNSLVAENAAKTYKYNISSYDQINVEPKFSELYNLQLYNWKVLVGTNPTNFEEIAIDSLAASILFPDENLNNIIGKAIDLDMIRNGTKFDNTTFTITAIYQYVPYLNNNFVNFHDQLTYRPIFLTEYPNFDTYQYKDKYINTLEENNNFQANIYFDGIKTGTNINTYSSKNYTYTPDYIAIGLAIIQLIIFSCLLILTMLFYFRYINFKKNHVIFIPAFALLATIYSVNTLRPTILEPAIRPLLLFIMIIVILLIIFFVWKYSYEIIQAIKNIKVTKTK